MRVNPRTFAFLCALGSLPALCRADDAAAKSALESVKLGDTWMGPNLDMEDLKGRVVLIEFWGIK